jgi:hypothetical protein
MLADGERLSGLWRYVFVQMLDDYSSVLRHAGVSAAARMWSGAPRAPGTAEWTPRSRRWPNTWPAAMDGRCRPGRGCPSGRRGPWWFVTDLRGLHPPRLGGVAVFVPPARSVKVRFLLTEIVDSMQ